MNELINAVSAKRLFGQTLILHEAMRRVGVVAYGPRKEQLYDKERLTAEVESLTASGWRRKNRSFRNRRVYENEASPIFDSERWHPDHPGAWTDADIAEFNRRHPFRRDFVTGFVHVVRNMKIHTERCKGKN